MLFPIRYDTIRRPVTLAEGSNYRTWGGQTIMMENVVLPVNNPLAGTTAHRNAGRDGRGLTGWEGGGGARPFSRYDNGTSRSTNSLLLRSLIVRKRSSRCLFEGESALWYGVQEGGAIPGVYRHR